MGRYLMTHSLLASWLYTMKENPYEDMTTERDPMGEFMQTLRREPTPTTEAMQNGIKFEDMVTDIIDGRADPNDPWYDAGKFFSSTQHPTYFELIPEARQFTYLASNGSAVWPETYRREEAPSIFPVISDFLDWLRATDLMQVYQEKWATL